MCHNVGTEPQLQPFSGEQLTLQSANREDRAYLDDFWGGNRNHAFFDVRVFSPFAQSYHNLPLAGFSVFLQPRLQFPFGLSDVDLATAAGRVLNTTVYQEVRGHFQNIF